MEESRAQKRARVENLRQRLPFISQRALAAILAENKKRPLPTVTQRAELRTARRELARQETPYGPMLQHLYVQSTSGGRIQVPYVHPFAFLHVALATCVQFAQLVSRVLVAAPCSIQNPWGLIAYADEACLHNYHGV